MEKQARNGQTSMEEKVKRYTRNLSDITKSQDCVFSVANGWKDRQQSLCSIFSMN